MLRLIHVTDKDGKVLAWADLEVVDGLAAANVLNDAVLLNPTISGIGLVDSVMSLLMAGNRGSIVIDGVTYTTLQVEQREPVGAGS